MKKINIILYSLAIFALISQGCDSEGLSDVSSPDFSTGRGGSMASFSVVGDNLYVVNGSHLKIYDVTQSNQPVLSADANFDRVLETTFVLGDNLFVGSQTGMLIYDISNPSTPILLSTFEHVTSCDPVVVTGNIAYVTLREGTDCNWGNNLLDIIDITDKRDPQLLNTMSMINPHGLAVDGNLLFVCEGAFGLKIFDISNRVQPMLIEHITNINTYDVIATSGNLIVTGDNLFMIYDYSDLEDVKLLHTLAF